MHCCYCCLFQTIGATLKDHLQGSGAGTAAQLQPLVPAIMEVLAGLIEEGIPEALAPFTKVRLPATDK